MGNNGTTKNFTSLVPSLMELQTPRSLDAGFHPPCFACVFLHLYPPLLLLLCCRWLTSLSYAKGPGQFRRRP